ncbi:MAG: hypothetical protein PWP46_1647 [Fusobacteriaceae bacterium]|jgi:cation transport ATPase|nr:hypothetical protein [Fusobacteriales bacterium]MDN5304761.1 hypothetical protein [Fusobacteriaceae bacterium]
MRKNKGILYWIINYIVFGYIGSLILLEIIVYTKEKSTFITMYIYMPLLISIFIFPIFYYGAKLLYGIFKELKTESWGMRIFTILAILGLFYRSCWDYNRTEKHKKEVEKNPQIEKQIK